MSAQAGYEDAVRVAGRAMARMTAEQVPPTPENYAVWYAHYSGISPDLSRTIEILVSNRQPITEERTAELYDRFVGNRLEAEAVRAAERTSRRHSAG